MKVLEVAGALNEAAQVNLISVEHQLVSVQAPEWLLIPEQQTSIVAPKPKFKKLD